MLRFFHVKYKAGHTNNMNFEFFEFITHNLKLERNSEKSDQKFFKKYDNSHETSYT